MLFAGTALLTSLAVQPAAAQALPSTREDASIAEVVVTASKTPTRLTEVPQSVSVVTREEMDLRGVQDLNGALSYSAGIKFRDYPGQQGMQEFFLRGFRANNTAGAVFRDGLRQQFNGLDGDAETYGLERVEFLKGPASVLYGQGSPGGLVNMTTKRPTKVSFGEVLVQTGSFDRAQGAVDIGGPIDDAGVWRYRVTALGRHSDTQFDYTVDHRKYLAPALSFVPSDRVEITLLSSYLQTRGGGSDQSFPVVGTFRANPNGELPQNEFFGDPTLNDYIVNVFSVGYDAKVKLADSLTFNQVLRYSESDTTFKGVNAANSGILANNRIMSRLAISRRAESRQALTDAHLAYVAKFGDIETTTLGGIDFAIHHRTNVQRNGTIGTLDVYNPVYNQPITWAATLASDLATKLRQTGVYAQEQAKWNGFTLTLGGRQDWVQSETRVRLTGARQSGNDDAFTGRVGLIYETAFGLAPYASYSTSFLPLAGSTFAGVPYAPTEGEQIEVGLKYEPAVGSMLTLSMYQLTQTNITTPDPAHSGFFVQQGEVQSRGVELEGRWQVTPALNLIGAYAYTDAKQTKANPNAAGVTALGLRQLAVPMHTLSAWANYRFQLGDGALIVGGGARYTAGSYNTDNSIKTDGYTLIDAVVEYDWRNWAASVNVTNLFDEKYFTPGFYTSTVFYGNARTVLGTLKYRW